MVAPVRVIRQARPVIPTTTSGRCIPRTPQCRAPKRRSRFPRLLSLVSISVFVIPRIMFLTMYSLISQTGLMRKVDRTGQRWGRLLVVEQAPNNGSWVMWKCRCDCGNKVEVRAISLASGNTRSCGCLQREELGERRFKHGMSQSNPRMYRVWRSMKSRCFNRNCLRYQDYGGRGITVCERWKESFAAFLQDVGEPPRPHLVIDRIDNDGNYEPSNVRWVTYSESARNRRRKT